MNRVTRLAIFAVAVPALTAIFSAAARAEEPPCPYFENRSGLCGYYHSEISLAEAFVNTVAKRGGGRSVEASRDPRRAQYARI